VERLQAAGHRAYTRAIDSSSSGSLTGVYVGPLVDRNTAASLQSDLQSSFGLAGQVVRYRIEEE
jgi:cell division septation protein DedD